MLLLLFVLICLARRYKREKLSITLVVVFLIAFLLSSTAYLPNYLATKLEDKFPPFQPSLVSQKQDPVLIHILGSGNNLDERLPANARLGLAALGRLTEGIRIQHL